MSPLYYAIGGALAFAAYTAAVGFYSYGAGVDAEVARKAKEESAVLDALEQSNQQTAQAIAGIKINHTTIVQKVRHEITKEPVYRDCVHTPDGLRYVNEALTGVSQPASGIQLPPADTPR